MRLILMLCIAVLGCAQDWPRFRGANGSGVSDSTGLPSEFGPKTNLVWRVEAPMGRSSPIVVKDKIYLTGIEEGKLLVLALDRQTGKTVWRHEIVRDHTNKIYVGNDSATPTAASDGENIYTFFPDAGLVSLDAAGRAPGCHHTWRRRNLFSGSSSPAGSRHTQ